MKKHSFDDGDEEDGVPKAEDEELIQKGEEHG